MEIAEAITVAAIEKRIKEPLRLSVIVSDRDCQPLLAGRFVERREVDNGRRQRDDSRRTLYRLSSSDSTSLKIQETGLQSFPSHYGSWSFGAAVILPRDRMVYPSWMESMTLPKILAMEQNDFGESREEGDPVSFFV